ncbi:MAG: hypothetical protein AB1631_30660, partial [Acidobacteriota bacterium]
LDTDIDGADPETLETLIKVQWSLLRAFEEFSTPDQMLEHLRLFAINNDWEVRTINRLADIEEDDYLRAYAKNLNKFVRTCAERRNVLK